MHCTQAPGNVATWNETNLGRMSLTWNAMCGPVFYKPTMFQFCGPIFACIILNWFYGDLSTAQWSLDSGCKLMQRAGSALIPGGKASLWSVCPSFYRIYAFIPESRLHPKYNCDFYFKLQGMLNCLACDPDQGYISRFLFSDENWVATSPYQTFCVTTVSTRKVSEKF